MFKEVTFSYNILSDPDKRRQYDSAGFEAVELESQELELDLSSLGAVNTMFAALFSKLGVPIKTTVSATVLEEALNGVVDIHPLPLGLPICRKVEKQCAHFYSVTITEEEARDGFVCRVQSSDKSKFKWPKSCYAATAHQYQTRGKKETFQRNGVKVTDYGVAKLPEKVKRAC